MVTCPKSADQERNGAEKKYYKAINDWALLPSELKRLMPKTIFKRKLKQFLFNHFKPYVVFLSSVQQFLNNFNHELQQFL